MLVLRSRLTRSLKLHSRAQSAAESRKNNCQALTAHKQLIASYLRSDVYIPLLATRLSGSTPPIVGGNCTHSVLQAAYHPAWPP